MSKSRRIISGAAVAALIGALAASNALAQDNSVVGPPQLRDFQLPGQRTPPPRPVGPVDDSPNASPPAAAQPRAVPPVVTAPAPSASVAPPPAAAPAARAPATPTDSRRTAPPQQQAPSRTAAPATPPPADPVLPPPATSFTPSRQLPAAPETAPDQAAAEAASSEWNPLWLLLPLLLVAGAALLFWRRRRRAEDVYELEEAVEAAPAPAEAPQWMPAAPVSARAAAPPKAAPSAAAMPASDEERAWLEVEFKPSRAAATDKEAIVHYELLLRNVGTTTAANIRIDTKLFNAGAEGEIKTFLGGPIHEQSGSPHVTIPPGEELRLGSTIAMAKEEVREIVVEGRSLFVPAVAIKVAYNWASGGAGRTSKSWLVGREAEQPSQKMGAFRLDLGPRIYRSVGQRQTGLAQMV